MPLTSRGPAAVLLLCGLVLVSACDRAGGGDDAVADLVEQVSPSVVNISTVSDPLGLPVGHPAVDEESDLSAPQSLGSGFVWSADGYVLTNYHVIRDAREIFVRLLDRRQFEATLVGHDEPSDLALLRIDATGLPAARLADARLVRPGQQVLAIGSPFGFDYSVTAGIISAKGRALDSEQYVPFLQTDAAINPGNSGGPLFNLRGEVVGVNSQIFSQTGGSTGVAFAIPVDVADKVARQLRDRGTVTRGWLGLVVQAVSRSQARELSLDKAEGAWVTDVLPDSPAEQAGLRAGDVILRFNGQALPSSRELPPLVGSVDPGDMVTLDLVRDRRRVEIRLEVGTLDGSAAARPDSDLAPLRPTVSPSPPPLQAEVGGALGLVIRALSPEERRDAQVLSGGVRLTEVLDGPALRAGLRPGDVLLQLNGQTVDSPDRFDEVVARLTPGATVPVLVQRRGAPLFLALDIPLAERQGRR
ncbi:trypsin-like peptidase domain-containing protein [Flagellatimonas centrodinii]|uniref:trypsin-like peptidase domain-containing protein n=1 Tax=Flagellatimonas centrodinii TaxID=2806210 RepID=UPI001FFAF801|nr:trypsin-like peptidase domain-containing protein [Flagellatimonas centrodinii]ULQ46576.1 trypsin-like peptidase domain-containing protein [Flagellatimonas centrodinii]